MKFKELKTPSPHIIIDNFLTDDEIESTKNEIKILLPNMKPGMKQFAKLDKKNKNNLNIWLDDFYNNKRNESNILQYMKKIWNKDTMNFMDNTYSSIFRTYRYTTQDTTLLSAYKNNSFYKKHVDDCAGGLFLTTNLMIGCGFKGGDFKLGNKVIPFKNNRLIIFESHREHSVTKLKTDNSPDNWRYSIQYFARLK
tara:strand:+ start:109 stop:696 length:588 start_codon:yes stop_codon:yes gene_type:complete